MDFPFTFHVLVEKYINIEQTAFFPGTKKL